MVASLYERIGGEAAIMAAVQLFYAKVLADPLVSPFFEGLDMDAQVKKQVSFMTWAFGGPEQHRGRDLREAHEKLVRTRGLSDPHFDAVVAHLEATLCELRVAPDVVEEVLGKLEPLRSQVLAR